MLHSAKSKLSFEAAGPFLFRVATEDVVLNIPEQHDSSNVEKHYVRKGAQFIVDLIGLSERPSLAYLPKRLDCSS